MQSDRRTFRYAPSSYIAPAGWAKEIVDRYAYGLLSSLEDIWPDVGEDNAWLGGSGDAWERGPYYVDGLVPMAFLSKDTGLLEKASKWVTAAIRSRRKDGNFGPESNNDWWPRMVMLKAVTAFADSSDDVISVDDALAFVTDYLDYFMTNIDSHPFEMWAYVRGRELIASIIWAFEKTGDGKYLDIGKKVLESSLDWYSFFVTMPFTLTAEHYLPWKAFEEYLEAFFAAYGAGSIEERRKNDVFFRIFHQSHGVNVAMALKYLAYDYFITGDEKYKAAIGTGWKKLMDHHGQANGIFSCDEHLNGTSPSRGTELCAVVEAMFSFEEIARVTGDFSFVDDLEKIFYNALPAAISSDASAHQYDQQVNQISATVAKRRWYNNLDDSNIFGLEPNFGCCTANMHQGLAKFIVSQWADDGRSAYCLGYAPGRYALRCGIEVDVDSDYPFIGKVKVRIIGKGKDDVPLMFRIPSWCHSIGIDVPAERNGSFLCVKKYRKDDFIELRFSAVPKAKGISGGLSIYLGPLLMALPIEAEKKTIKDRGRFSDFELRPSTKWNYAICRKSVDDADVAVADSPLLAKGRPYPVQVRLEACRAIGWNMDGNEADDIPASVQKGEKKIIELVPYGCTDLRVAVFPEG